MTPERIAELRALIAGATKLPWRFGFEFTRVIKDANGYTFAQVDDDGNGRLAAGAANALGECLDEIERLRDALRRMAEIAMRAECASVEEADFEEIWRRELGMVTPAPPATS